LLRRFAARLIGRALLAQSVSLWRFTENHAEKRIDPFDTLLNLGKWVNLSGCANRDDLRKEHEPTVLKVKSALGDYAQDFGDVAAARLEAFARRNGNPRTAPQGGRGAWRDFPSVR